MNTAIKPIVASVSGLSDYEKVRRIHDFIVNQTSYDRSYQFYSAYDALVRHAGVCHAYALLTYKLMTDAGIPCRYERGYAKNSLFEGPHAWNIVKVDGIWYYLDVTWDDPIGNREILRHDYFLVGSKRFLRNHTPDAEFLKAEFQTAYPMSRTDYAR